MTVELLISTMHQKDHSLLDRMNVASDAVVINQCNRESREELFHRGHQVIWINTTERGLSRSRNMAIHNATADICIIADDDMEYRPDYAQQALSAFDLNDADIIGFQVMGIEKEFKKYSPDECRVSYLKSMKMASVELAFRRSSIIENSIRFDELIGAGTDFLMGEENAFLFHCLKEKLRIYYLPQVIADLHVGQSSWFTKRDEQYFVGKGAAFTAMSTPFATLLILQYAIRKRKLFQKDTPLPVAIRQMFKGKRLYIQKRGNQNDT